MKKVFLLSALTLSVLTGCNDDNSSTKQIEEIKKPSENEIWTFLQSPENIYQISELRTIEIEDNIIYSTPYNSYHDNEDYYNYPTYYFNAHLFLTFSTGNRVTDVNTEQEYDELYPLFTEDSAYQVTYDIDKENYKFGVITEVTPTSWKFKVPKLSTTESNSNLEITTTFDKKNLSNTDMSTLFGIPVNEKTSLKFPEGSYCLSNINSVSNQRFITVGSLYQGEWDYNVVNNFGDKTTISERYDGYIGFSGVNFRTTLLSDESLNGYGYLTYSDQSHSYDYVLYMLQYEEDSAEKIEIYKARCLYFNKIALKHIKDNYIQPN